MDCNKECLQSAVVVWAGTRKILLNLSHQDTVFVGMIFSHRESKACATQLGGSGRNFRYQLFSVPQVLMDKNPAAPGNVILDYKGHDINWCRILSIKRVICPTCVPNPFLSRFFSASMARKSKAFPTLNIAQNEAMKMAGWLMVGQWTEIMSNQWWTIPIDCPRWFQFSQPKACKTI